MVDFFVEAQRQGFQELNRERELILNILNSTTDGFFFADNTWKVLYWNKSAEAILGRPQAEIIGKDLWEVYDDAKGLDFFTKYQKAKRENIPVEFEAYYPTKDIWVEVRAFPSTEGLSVYFKDITSKKSIDLELQYYKFQQEAIINSTNDLLWSVDKNFNLLIANKSFIDTIFKVTNYALKPGDALLEGFSEEEKAKWIAYYEKALLGNTFKVDVEVADQEGVEGQFSEVGFNPIFDSFGQVIGVACHGRDITERKRYEQLIEEKNRKLEEKEYHLREVSNNLENVLNFSLDIICTINSNGRYVQVNKASRSLLGYEPEELIGKHFSEVTCGDDIEATLEATKSILAGGRVTAFRNRLVKKNGKLIHIIWSARWDEEKQLMFCVARDASTLVQAEIIKAATERKFTALLEKGADMVGIIDEFGRYSFVTPNVQSILGFSDTELIGKNAFDFIHPEDSLTVLEQLQTVLEGGEIKKSTFRFKNANNNWRWLEIVATNLLNDLAINGIVINSRDVTDRKLQEEAIKASNERFEMVLKATNDSIWDWNLATGELYWNESYKRNFGYETTSSQLYKIEDWFSKIHPEDRDRVVRGFFNKLENFENNLWQDEYKYIKNDGEIADVFDRGFIILNEQNKPVRFVGSMQDITARKKTENERELLIAELTRNNADLKEFSFITSHNLRAPLSNITGLLNVIDDTTLDATNKPLFDMLKTSTCQLQQTIDDLTSIIVVRSKEDVEITKVNLKCTFEKALKIYLNPANHIAHAININFKEHFVYTNQKYLSSIFINLLSNSVKFKSPRRILKIEVTSTTNDNGEVEITYTDNGIGFDSVKRRDRLFGLYQRFHHGFEGRGIGLFTVKSQLSAIGGTVDIASEVDKGTTVIIKLPK